ncbi:MAG: ROK family protein [Candidatus Neomarinimicrobiota bacterium]
MSKQVVLGIDIGGTNTVYGLIGKNGNIYHYEDIPTKGSKPIKDLIDRLDSSLTNIMSQNSEFELTGIGIGAPNGNHYTGMIQDPPNLSWGNVDVVNIFKERFNCNVDLTNDANAAALGEKHYGIANNMNDFVVITLGTGLGSGIFSGGKLIYGHDGFAGEMGHMPIDDDGRECNCGNRGCLEAYASASGIKKTIKYFLDKTPNDEFLIRINGDKVDGLLLDSEFDKGNEVAQHIYSYTGKKLGQGLAQVATLLSPEAFIFYGGFSNAGHRILEPAKKSMDRHLINGHAGKIELLASGLPQGQAGILGAASLIWSS